MQKPLLENVRASPPPVENLKEQVRGNPDLELVLQRVEQIDLLLEGIAELMGARKGAEQSTASAKIAANRQDLRGSLSERYGTRQV